MTKIASFNVNSINARLPRLLEWLKYSNPDIVCLQELKCLEEKFPFEALLDAGYNCAVSGQKTYNGVAILSKYKIEDVVKTLPMLDSDEEQDQQARYIEAVIAMPNQALRIASIYVPNGGSELLPNQKLEDSAKFIYKLKFFQRLQNHLSKLLKYDEMQFFAGDFNVAIDDLDIVDPKAFAMQILFHPHERQAMRSILNLGLSDSYRLCNQGKKEFSWWDYRGNCYEKNYGARIDYILLSAQALDKLSSAEIENVNVRDQEKASDHCPVVVNIL